MDWDFSWVDLKQPLCIDTECTSFDNDVPALKPYDGHRITMIGLIQKGKPAHTYCLRNLHSSEHCLPLEKFLKDFREFAAEVKWLYGQNVKFDLHMSAMDKIYYPKALKIEDLMVLDRLHYYDENDHDMDAIAARHNCTKRKESKELKDYLHRVKSQDYGVVPYDILNRYLIDDLELEQEAYWIMVDKLPEISQQVRMIEAELTPVLFEMEHRGIWLDKKFLLERKINLLMQQVNMIKKVKEASCGRINNPASTKQKAEYFNFHNIAPVLWTKDKKTKKNKNPSWSTEALQQIEYIPVIRDTVRALIKYSNYAYQEQSFCTPWMDCCGKDDMIHPNFKAHGAKTGRLSATSPNVYNPPEWLMEAIKIPAGYVGVKWDKKQIEYRLFAHYTEDATLLKQYAENPDIDYHQIVGDRYGLPRNPVKEMNFGIIYGMGEDKTKRQLAAKLIENDSVKLRTAMRGFLKRGGGNPDALGDVGTPIEAHVIITIANQVLKEYHAGLPCIKELFTLVKITLKQRGYIRNYFGRIYKIPISRAYTGVNCLIQGSAADLYKKKLTELSRAKPADAHFIDMIYDSCYAITKIEVAQEYWDTCRRVVQDCPFKVPVLIDGEVAIYNWGNVKKISNNSDILSDIAIVA